MNEPLSIREVAARTGLSAHTLRYYERIGLLDPVEREATGHRRYAAADLAWIDFLNRLRATGMPIRGMRKFAELRRGGDATVAARRALLEHHKAGVETHLRALKEDLAAVTDKIEEYRQLEQLSATSKRRTA